MSALRWLDRFDLDSPPPSIKQIPTAIAFGVSLLLTLLPSVGITNQLWVTIGVALVVIATIAAVVVPWERLGPAWDIAVPLLSMLAIGFFRLGTGGYDSIFAAIMILPIVWIASEEGFRYVFVAVGASVLIQLMPIFANEQMIGDGAWLRAFITPFVYALAAGIINDLSHRLRTRINAIETIGAEKQELLVRSEQYTVELERQKERLLSVEEFNRSIWNSATEQALIATDMNGVIEAFNPGAVKMLGYASAEVEGSLHIAALHNAAETASDRDIYLAGLTPEERNAVTFEQTMDRAQASFGDTRAFLYRRADGSEFPVRLTCTSRVDSTGERQGFLFVAIDSTQEQEVSRLKDEFVGLVSHELRTPLSSILGYLELLRDDDDDELPLSETRSEYLAVAERNAQRLLGLVGDLLFTAQVESGKFPVDRQLVDVSLIVAASVDSAKPAASASHIELVFVGEADAGSVLADPMRLAQAIDNLVSNAIKFTPADGTVSVEVERHDNMIHITVSDTGVGIPANEVDQLFTRFFRSTTSMRNAVQGVGLGLSITKAIVAAHEGVMAVESEEGRGATFTISLPLTANVDDVA